MQATDAKIQMNTAHLNYSAEKQVFNQFREYF